MSGVAGTWKDPEALRALCDHYIRRASQTDVMLTIIRLKHIAERAEREMKAGL